MGALDDYLCDIRRLGGNLPAGLEDRAMSAVRSSVPALDLKQMHIVHGDPDPTNVFVESSGLLRFLDLELTHWGDPMMDLATLGIFDFGKRPGEWANFLHGYGRSLTKDERRRVSVCRLLRIVRLMRGKLWMYRDLAAFEEHVTELEAVIIHLEERRCRDPRPLWLP